MDYEIMRTNFESHGFVTEFFNTKEEAVAFFKQELQLRTIGFGGSATLKEIGLYEVLSENNAVVWHNKIPARDVRRLANCASIYITSANAVTQTGELVNIDATGNRVSMMSFGPETCYYVVGKNKITESLQDAYTRCKNVAAPKNAQRLKVKTPCAQKGDKCYNCNSPERICRVTTIIERPPNGMKNIIVFIDENLGM